MTANRLSQRDPYFERRRERRFDCDFTFSVGRQNKSSALAQVTNLSSTGIRFQYLGLAIQPEEPVLLQLSYGGSTFSMCGKPVRNRKIGAFVQEVAMAFVGMDPRQRERLGVVLRNRGRNS